MRLALFAEMMKGKPWTPATLREVGGTQGVGLTFLEETFSASTAPPEHRLHQKAAQAVLKALLPESGTDIKGQMRSRQELLEASGYANRPRDFDDLIRILDPELRLITPTDPEGSSARISRPAPSGQYYQLTHDYLVHSLRDWLTRKQRETRRGRAELRLAERSASWNAKPENRHLPSALEWANIRLLTRKKDWTEPQRRMMRRAGRVHGLRTLGVATLIALLTWGGIEGYGRLRASKLVESLQTASTADVPAIIRQLQGYRRWANPRLKTLVQNADDNSREKLHASLALLPVDASQLPFLEKHLLDATPAELPVIRDALKPHRCHPDPEALVRSRLRQARRREPAPGSECPGGLRPRMSPRWESMGEQGGASLGQRQSRLSRFLARCLASRARAGSTTPLAAIFRDKDRPETEHTLATNILTDYASDDPDLIAESADGRRPQGVCGVLPHRRAAGGEDLAFVAGGDRQEGNDP